MDLTNLLVEIRDRILYITINRESKLNALNKLTLAELHDVITQSFHDDAVGGIIITGAGPKAFVAGADISEFSQYPGEKEFLFVPYLKPEHRVTIFRTQRSKYWLLLTQRLHQSKVSLGMPLQVMHAMQLFP